MSLPTVIVPSTGGMPDFLKALNASRDYSPPSAGALCICVQGASGIGKSTFAFGVPNSLYLDLEDGGHSVPFKEGWWVRCPVLAEGDLTDALKNPPPHERKPPAVSFGQAMLKLREIAKMKDNPIRTVVIDSFDKLQSLHRERLEKLWGKKVDEYKDGTAGWGVLNYDSTAPIKELKKLGYGVIVISHFKGEWKKVPGSRTGEEMEVLSPAMTPGAWRVLKPEFDYILALGKGERFDPATQKTVSSYMIMTQVGNMKRGDTDMKVRVPLPDVIPKIPLKGGFKEFERVYEESVRKQQEAIAKEKSE